MHFFFKRSRDLFNHRNISLCGFISVQIWCSILKIQIELKTAFTIESDYRKRQLLFVRVHVFIKNLVFIEDYTNGMIGIRIMFTFPFVICCDKTNMVVAGTIKNPNHTTQHYQKYVICTCGNHIRKMLLTFHYSLRLYSVLEFGLCANFEHVHKIHKFP